MSRPPVWLRALLLTLVAAAAIAAAYAEPFNDAGRIGAELAASGPLMPALFIAAHVVSSLIFVPRAAMAVAAGSLWEFWPACLVSLIGATAGATAGFLLARYLNAGTIAPEEMKHVGPLVRRAEAGGWRTVMAVRLVPVLPHALTSYVFGLTRLRLVEYVFGSFCGLLPATFVFVNLGVTGRRELEGGAWLEPLLWGAAFLVLSLVLPRLVRRAAP